MALDASSNLPLVHAAASPANPPLRDVTGTERDLSQSVTLPVGKERRALVTFKFVTDWRSSSS